MPGYIIHLTEAEYILKKMPLGLRNNLPSGNLYQEWHDAFIYGVLLPDAAGKAVKRQTHFWNDKNLDDAIVVPDINQFLEKYAKNLKEPLMLGYLAHLHLDKIFFTEYFHSKVKFLDGNGTETSKREQVSNAWLEEQQRTVPPQTLFSDEYLYGDYTKLNGLLLQKHPLELPKVGHDVGNPFSMDVKILVERAYQEIDRYLKESAMVTGAPALLNLESVECFMEVAAQKFWEMVEEYLQ